MYKRQPDPFLPSSTPERRMRWAAASSQELQPQLHWAEGGTPSVAIPIARRRQTEKDAQEANPA